MTGREKGRGTPGPPLESHDLQEGRDELGTHILLSRLLLTGRAERKKESMSQAVWTTETILGCHKNLVTRGFQLKAQSMSQNGESTFVFFNSAKPDPLRKPQDRELNVSGLVLAHV